MGPRSRRNSNSRAAANQQDSINSSGGVTETSTAPEDDESSVHESDLFEVVRTAQPSVTEEFHSSIANMGTAAPKLGNTLHVKVSANGSVCDTSVTSDPKKTQRQALFAANAMKSMPCLKSGVHFTDADDDFLSLGTSGFGIDDDKWWDQSKGSIGLSERLDNDDLHFSAERVTRPRHMRSVGHKSTSGLNFVPASNREKEIPHMARKKSMATRDKSSSPNNSKRSAGTRSSTSTIKMSLASPMSPKRNGKSKSMHSRTRLPEESEAGKMIARTNSSRSIPWKGSSSTPDSISKSMRLNRSSVIGGPNLSKSLRGSRTVLRPIAASPAVKRRRQKPDSDIPFVKGHKSPPSGTKLKNLPPATPETQSPSSTAASSRGASVEMTVAASGTSLTPPIVVEGEQQQHDLSSQDETQSQDTQPSVVATKAVSSTKKKKKSIRKVKIRASVRGVNGTDPTTEELLGEFSKPSSKEEVLSVLKKAVNRWKEAKPRDETCVDKQATKRRKSVGRSSAKDKSPRRRRSQSVPRSTSDDLKSLGKATEKNKAAVSKAAKAWFEDGMSFPGGFPPKEPSRGRSSETRSVPSINTALSSEPDDRDGGTKRGRRRSRARPVRRQSVAGDTNANSEQDGTVVERRRRRKSLTRPVRRASTGAGLSNSPSISPSQPHALQSPLQRVMQTISPLKGMRNLFQVAHVDAPPLNSEQTITTRDHLQGRAMCLSSTKISPPVSPPVNINVAKRKNGVRRGESGDVSILSEVSDATLFRRIKDAGVTEDVLQQLHQAGLVISERG